MELFEDEEQTKLDFHIGDRGKLFAPDPSPQLDWMPHLSLDDPQFEDKIVQIIVRNTNRITSWDGSTWLSPDPVICRAALLCSGIYDTRMLEWDIDVEIMEIPVWTTWVV